MNILFLGGAKRVSLGERFLSAGQQRGIGISLFSYELSETAPIAGIAKVIKGVRWADPALYDDLADIISKFEIDIVLPFVDPATLVAAELRERHPDVFIPVSDRDICTVFFDKAEAHEWYRKKGLLVPECSETPPLILKPRKGSASSGILFAKNQAELDCYTRLMGKKRENYLFQRCVSGDEYTVDCYVSQRGQIISIVPRKRLEIVGGEVVKTQVIKDENIIGASKKLIETARLIGPLTMQFIRDDTDNCLYLIEVNPRFGGGALASITAGADSPLAIVDECLGRPVKPVMKWEEGLIMARAHREFYFHADNH